MLNMKLSDLVTRLSASVPRDEPKWLSGGVRIGHTPHVARLAYLHTIYAPASEVDLQAAAQALGRRMPEDYQRFLVMANGVRLFGGALDLGGVVGQVDRRPESIGQAISLRYGNVVERPEGLSADDFAIGGIVGQSTAGVLIMDAAGRVRLVHGRDGSDVAADWLSLDAMLESEIERLSQLFDSEGRRRVEASEQLPPGARHWEAPRTTH